MGCGKINFTHVFRDFDFTTINNFSTWPDVDRKEAEKVKWLAAMTRSSKSKADSGFG